MKYGWLGEEVQHLMEISRVNDEVLLKYTNNHNGINNLIIQVLRQAHVRLHETTQIDHQRRKVRLKQLRRTAFQIRQFRARIQIIGPPLLTAVPTLQTISVI